MNTPLTSSQSYQAIISPQGQITVPAEIRKLLGLKPGNQLSLVVKEVAKGIKSIVAYVVPDDPIEKYYGIGEDFYKKHGGAAKVIAEERKSWEGWGER